MGKHGAINHLFKVISNINKKNAMMTKTALDTLVLLVKSSKIMIMILYPNQYVCSSWFGLNLASVMISRKYVIEGFNGLCDC